MTVTTAPFESIVCGVEGSPSSAEAARQAVALAAPGAKLRFVSVRASFEPGPENHRERLQEGLEKAEELAREAGVEVSADMREGRYATEVLLEEARSHDLLVLGTHGNSRASGIVFGSTASESAHSTDRPLLVARKPPEGRQFPERILVASDGTEGSRAPVSTAARIAVAFDAELELLHVDDRKNGDRRGMVEKEGAELTKLLGRKPSITSVSGHPVREIVGRATDIGASLIVCGRRGLTGLKALGSVSERVVHSADCSVLLVPAEPPNAARS